MTTNTPRVPARPAAANTAIDGGCELLSDVAEILGN